LWSALRYCYIASLTKEVDDTPWLWTPSWTGFAHEQSAVDLFALSQEPYLADAWKKRREAQERKGQNKKARTAFTKLDLTSVIISKHLWSRLKFKVEVGSDISIFGKTPPTGFGDVSFFDVLFW